MIFIILSKCRVFILATFLFYILLSFCFFAVVGEEQKKLQQEYQDYQKKLEQQKAEYRKDHPDEVS